MQGEALGLGARERLLVAADGFSRTPYTELSVAQIIAHARVQAPTLYHHFRDKEGLFVRWSLGALERMAADLQSPTLVTVAAAVMEPEHPDLIQLARDIRKLDRQESRDQIFDALQQCLYEPLYALLLQEMAQGRLRQEPVHPTAAVFVTGASALRPNGALEGVAVEDGPAWWVERFLTGFRR